MLPNEEVKKTKMDYLGKRIDVQFVVFAKTVTPILESERSLFCDLDFDANLFYTNMDEEDPSKLPPYVKLWKKAPELCKSCCRSDPWNYETCEGCWQRGRTVHSGFNEVGYIRDDMNHVIKPALGGAVPKTLQISKIRLCIQYPLKYVQGIQAEYIANGITLQGLWNRCEANFVVPPPYPPKLLILESTLSLFLKRDSFLR